MHMLQEKKHWAQGRNNETAGKNIWREEEMCEYKKKRFPECRQEIPNQNAGKKRPTIGEKYLIAEVIP